MYKIIEKFKNWIIFWIWFSLILWIVNAFTIISNVNNWDTLTADLFNKLIDNQSELQNNKQNRITWTCAVWSAIKTINNDWTVICETRLQWPKWATWRTWPQWPAGTFAAPTYFTPAASRASNLWYTANDNRNCDLYCKVVRWYTYWFAARIVRANNGWSNLCWCFN